MDYKIIQKNFKNNNLKPKASAANLIRENNNINVKGGGYHNRFLKSKENLSASSEDDL